MAPELGTQPLPADALTHAAELGQRLCAAANEIMEGKSEVVQLAVTTLLAEGHLLIEDVPGVGKTLLATTLGHSFGGTVHRIQFTPDLLPSDVTGVSMWDPDQHTFIFRPGAVFAHVVIADEINRASPKTQSALLECMEEAQVTAEGIRYPLDLPFLVVATQNPMEMEGTYPLPEAQRDRFMTRLTVGYPAAAAEADMLKHHIHGRYGHGRITTLPPISTLAEVRSAQDAVRSIHVSHAVREYAVSLVSATRNHPDLRLGASPRATLHLLALARSHALVQQREYVLPDDLQALLNPVLGHRLILSPGAIMRQATSEQILEEIADRVSVLR
jgi:MoxR-like ATPase